MGNDFPSTSQAEIINVVDEKRVIPKTKEELVTDWLIAHPEDMEKTGRELESNLLEGIKISYKTWNEVKKKVRVTLGK